MNAINRAASFALARGGYSGRVLLLPLLLCAATVVITSVAFAQIPAQAPAGKTPGLPGGPTFTKEQALNSTINALVLNGSPPAWASLAKLVTGETTTNGLDRIAARTVLTHLAARGTPDSEALILQVICNAEQVRPPGRGDCTAEDLREDMVEILSVSGSPSMRRALAAKLADPQTSKEGREAIASIFKAPLPENIPFQIQLLSEKGADDSVKAEIIASLSEVNKAVVKEALGLEAEGSVAPAGMPAMPPGMKGMPPGISQGMPSPAAGMMPNPQSLPGSKLAGSLVSSLRRVFVADAAGAGGGDPSNPAQALWSAPFAAALAKQIAADESRRPEMLGFLASLPAAAPRAKLYEYLEKNWMEGPTGLAGAAKDFKFTVNGPAGNAPRPKKIGKRGDDDDDDKTKRASQQPGADDPPAKVENKIESFGENWLDPGALVVLKSFSYLDRPRESKKPQRTDQPPAFGGGAIKIRRGDDEPSAEPRSTKSAAAQKREQERESKQKTLEARYDWRDAIERFIHVLNGRFETVAQQPAAKDAGAEPPADDAKSDAKADAKSAAKPGGGPKVTLEGMSFPLHDGAEVVKEFRGHWPAPGGPGAKIVEPLTVHYVRIEGEAAYGKVVSHYKAAIKTRKPSMLRDIEEGRWIDALQEGSSPNRDRSVDVFVTHTAAEPGEVRKTEPIVVEILTIEIPHVGPAKSAAKGTASNP